MFADKNVLVKIEHRFLATYQNWCIFIRVNIRSAGELYSCYALMSINNRIFK